ncbi:MAG: hypothetical protein JSU63_04900 [Phycisphaerales bacterium]|nr:MAG: hypothetical protein JSU63_04900 [Phycisphaerales bacterium]
MARNDLSKALLAAAGVVLLTTPVWADDPAAEAQNKLLAKRAAEADCFRKLAETVYGLQLTSDTYVRDFVTESDEIRTSVNAWVKGVRLGPPRYYDDGTCEVDGEVTVAKLITKLKEIYTEHYSGNSIKTTDFEHIQQSVKTDVIRVTGAGAPRTEIPDLPEGFEDAITPLPDGVVLTRSIPAIWKTVSPQARLMAERAAKVDGMRRLLEQIKGLRLDSNTLVRDFVTEYDEISTRANGIVIGATEVSKYLHHDELIAEVTMEVPVEKVITKLKELHTQHYKGNRVKTTHITDIKKTVQRKTIRATGSGVPPFRFISQARNAGVDVPDWMSRKLEATGLGTDPDIQSAQGRLKAARAAELDAKRKLVEQVYGLQISSNTSVRDFVTEYDEISAQVSAVLANAVAGAASFEGGVATVTVSLPAADVWTVVHQHMLIIERRG